MQSITSMNPKKISSVLSHESISIRAYELWQQQGAPEGQDLAFWLQAEIELRPRPDGSTRIIDQDRLQEFLDAFGHTARSRGPTSLNLT